MASIKVSSVRALTFRRYAFTFDQSCSMGFKSGLYGGRNHRSAPAARMASPMSGNLGETWGRYPCFPLFRRLPAGGSFSDGRPCAARGNVRSVPPAALRTLHPPPGDPAEL